MKNISSFDSLFSKRNILSILALILLILLALILIGPTASKESPISKQEAVDTTAGQMVFIRGHVYSEDAIAFLENVNVALYNKAYKTILEEKKTGERGFFVFKASLGYSYLLISTKEGYLSDTSEVVLPKSFAEPQIDIDIDLAKSAEPSLTILNHEAYERSKLQIGF